MALTITLRSGDAFTIGDEIKVFIEFDRDRGNQIRVRISAPEALRISRLPKDGEPREQKAARLAAIEYICPVSILDPDERGARFGVGVPGSKGYGIARLCNVPTCERFAFYGQFLCGAHLTCQECGASEDEVRNRGHNIPCVAGGKK